MENTTDQELKLLNKAQEEAFKTTYNLYCTQLIYYALKFVTNKADAEDIVAGVFINLYHSVASGRQFQSRDHLRSFLFVATRNAVFNHLSKSRRQ